MIYNSLKTSAHSTTRDIKLNFISLVLSENFNFTQSLEVKLMLAVLESH